MTDERPHETTLAEARAALKVAMDEGLLCPCCGQRVQLYRRRINRTMVRQLIALAREAHRSGDEWVDWQKAIVRQRITTTGDYAKLRYWGLVEPLTHDPRRIEESTIAGWWRVTKHGYAFLGAEVRVPRIALVFNSKCSGLTGPLVSVSDALREPFDLQTLYTDRS